VHPSDRHRQEGVLMALEPVEVDALEVGAQLAIPQHPPVEVVHRHLERVLPTEPARVTSCHACISQAPPQAAIVTHQARRNFG
jgi:hypothetical protein